MGICWERAAPLALDLNLYVPFPMGVSGRMWKSIISVPGHCLYLLCAHFTLF